MEYHLYVRNTLQKGDEFLLATDISYTDLVDIMGELVSMYIKEQRSKGYVGAVEVSIRCSFIVYNGLLYCGER